MTQLLCYLLLPKRCIFSIILFFSVGLLSAWFFQYGLGYEPCDLCYLQRWPYYILIIFGATWLIFSHAFPRFEAYHPLIIKIMLLILAVSVGLGIYHAGVEWAFWSGPSSCGGASAYQPIMMEDIMSALEAPRIVPCDKASFRFLGLSFAGYNVLLSFSLMIYGLVSLKFHHKA